MTATGGRPDRIADPWGARTPYARDGEWPVRVEIGLAIETVAAAETELADELVKVGERHKTTTTSFT